MKYRYMLSAAFVASTVAISNADVAGLIQENSYYKADGNTASDLSSAAYAVMDLYLDFSTLGTDGYPVEDAYLLNMYGVNVTARGFTDFHQSDFTPDGSWVPSLSFPLNSPESNIDSFVTIGIPDPPTMPNATSLDPNFNNGANSDVFGADIGWYAPPSAEQGGVDDSLESGSAVLVSLEKRHVKVRISL